MLQYLRVLKIWIEEDRTNLKIVSEAHSTMIPQDDSYVILMVVIERTAFSRSFARCWSMTTSVSLSLYGVCHVLHVRNSLHRIPLTFNHRRLRLQWTDFGSTSSWAQSTTKFWHRRPPEMPFSKVTFRIFMTPCCDVYELPSLRMSPAGNIHSRY